MSCRTRPSVFGMGRDHDFEATNVEPKPFRWTKPDHDILASVKRFWLRTLGEPTAEEALVRTPESGH